MFRRVQLSSLNSVFKQIQARQSRFYFPILIQEMYPAGIKQQISKDFFDFLVQASMISSGSSTIGIQWA